MCVDSLVRAGPRVPCVETGLPLPGETDGARGSVVSFAGAGLLMSSSSGTGISRLKALLGSGGWLDTPAEMAGYLQESRGQWGGASPLVVRPGDTATVAEVVRICAAHDLAVVPQGGNTGRMAAACPQDRDREVVLSLERMRRIRRQDRADRALEVEAGCTLRQVHEAAVAMGCLFGLDLGSAGSAQVGGLIATNAGGVRTLRDGCMRQQVLGLEVVLADGRIWRGLSRLRKENTGGDLNQLFIGTEGILGVITAASLRVRPHPERQETLWAAVPDPAAALALLLRLQAVTGEALSAFELMPRLGVAFAVRHCPDAVWPLPAASGPWFVLAEAEASGVAARFLRETLETALAEALAAGEIADAVLAAGSRQRQGLWRVREGLVEAQSREGVSLKHDLAVPVSALPVFLDEALAWVAAEIPGVRPVVFGHLGDGSLHFNLTQPEGADPQAFRARGAGLARGLHDRALAVGGAISAEHGIGLAKREEWVRTTPAEKQDLLRRLKMALDPQARFNPGKILPPR